MKYIEDDFDLEEYKKSLHKNISVETEPKKHAVNILVSVLMWVLAFLVAYPLFRGGQYLIDLFLK